MCWEMLEVFGISSVFILLTRGYVCMSGENTGEKRVRTPERDFGDELGKLRYRVNQGKGINQKKIGERMGVSEVTIRNWKVGDIGPLHRICSH